MQDVLDRGLEAVERGVLDVPRPVHVLRYTGTLPTIEPLIQLGQDRVQGRQRDPGIEDQIAVALELLAPSVHGHPEPLRTRSPAGRGARSEVNSGFLANAMWTDD